MGFLAEIAVFLTGLIALYATLHDYLGLNIVGYSVFDTYLAPLFVACLFLILVGGAYWAYCILVQPFSKKRVRLLKISAFAISIGIFLTAMPLEKNTVLNLILGKLLIIGGPFIFYGIDKFLSSPSPTQQTGTAGPNSRERNLNL